MPNTMIEAALQLKSQALYSMFFNISWAQVSLSTVSKNESATIKLEKNESKIARKKLQLFSFIMGALYFHVDSLCYLSKQYAKELSNALF